MYGENVPNHQLVTFNNLHNLHIGGMFPYYKMPMSFSRTAHAKEYLCYKMHPCFQQGLHPPMSIKPYEVHHLFLQTATAIFMMG